MRVMLRIAAIFRTPPPSPPTSVAGVASGDGARARYVGAAGALRHPLPRGPELARVARREAAQRPALQRLVAVELQAARRAVGHRERATVDGRRRREEVEPRQLVEAR